MNDINDDEIKDTKGRFYNVDVKHYYDYENSFDFEDIHSLNKEIYNVSRALYVVTEKLNTADRMAVRLSHKYERKYRQLYLTMDGKTESIKKAKSEMECEDDYEQVLIYKQVVKELERSANVLRSHLQTLQALSNNIRQQLRL